MRRRYSAPERRRGGGARAASAALAALVLLFSGCGGSAVPRGRLAESEAARGALLAEDGRHREAMEAYRSAAELAPDSVFYRYEAARCALLAGEAESGARWAERLYRDFPDNLLVIELLAYGRLTTGDSGGALELYLEILDRQPGYAPAVWNVAGLYGEQERYAEAYALLKGLYGGPGESGGAPGGGKIDGSPEERYRRFLRLADLAELSGEGLEAEAAGWIGEALGTGYAEEGGEAPDGDDAAGSAGLRLRAAGLLEAAGAWREAAEYYREAAEEPGGGGEVLFALARVLVAELEEYPEGLAVLRRALEAGFDDDAALAGLLERPDLLDPEAVRAVLDEFGRGGGGSR